ncbi:DUF4381 domain-containing protein [Aliidiomarina sp. Khilg15.8]
MNTPLNLHDIVEAEAVGWWPLAWGWWVLIGLGLAGSAALCLYLVHWRRRHRAQRLALQVLQQEPLSMAQITLLTKQAALAYFSRHDIAPLSGQRWFDFLIETMPATQQADFKASLMPWLDELYAASTQPADDYQRLMQRWIKQALPPTSKEAADV